MDISTKFLFAFIVLACVFCLPFYIRIWIGHTCEYCRYLWHWRDRGPFRHKHDACVATVRTILEDAGNRGAMLEPGATDSYAAVVIPGMPEHPPRIWVWVTVTRDYMVVSIGYTSALGTRKQDAEQVAKLFNDERSQVCKIVYQTQAPPDYEFMQRRS
jgi:hypothetical protein